jgi:hypothetical protein
LQRKTQGTKAVAQSTQTQTQRKMTYNWSFIQESSDAGLEHQWNIVSQRLQHNSNYPGMTVEQTVEFRDALKVEIDQRWENGGKQKFQEMLIKTFGSNAITLNK